MENNKLIEDSNDSLLWALLKKDAIDAATIYAEEEGLYPIDGNELQKAFKAGIIWHIKQSQPTSINPSEPEEKSKEEILDEFTIEGTQRWWGTHNVLPAMQAYADQEVKKAIQKAEDEVAKFYEIDRKVTIPNLRIEILQLKQQLQQKGIAVGLLESELKSLQAYNGKLVEALEKCVDKLDSLQYAYKNKIHGFTEWPETLQGRQALSSITDKNTKA